MSFFMTSFCFSKQIVKSGLKYVMREVCGEWLEKVSPMWRTREWFVQPRQREA